LHAAGARFAVTNCIDDKRVQRAVAIPFTGAERHDDNGGRSVVQDARMGRATEDTTLMENTSMAPRFASRVAVVAAAALFGVGGAVFAQPMHHHGHHGGGDVVMSIVRLKNQLNLNTSQQAMWDNAVAAGKAARTSARANMQKVHDTLVAELAKPEPDLAAVAAASDSARNANAQLRTQVRDAWLNLYSTFTPEQKTVVKNALSQRLAKMEQFRQKMQARRHGG
jgi:Spy/CpxP family protein refolding chaperone